jgi:hypothetical protein
VPNFSRRARAASMVLRSPHVAEPL